MYAVGKTAITTSGRNFFWSTNKGASWISTNGSTIRPLGGADTALCIAVDASGHTPESQILYVGLVQFGLYKSTDAGSTWFSTGLNGKSVQTIAVSPAVPSRVYAGTYVGLFRSTNSGGTFPDSPLRSGNVKRIVFDPRYPYSADRLFIVERVTGAPADSVYHTTNGGSSWMNVTGGLPSVIHSLASDPLSPFVLYAATPLGVYKAQLSAVGIASLSVSILSDWNMVSVPVEANKAAPFAVWPQAISRPFLYNQGNQEVDTVSNGWGYWIKFPTGPQPATYTGTSLSYLEIPVRAGWNIIGSISTAVDTGAVQAVPTGNRLSKFFNYELSGYVTTDSIYPGRGYWVKVLENGSFILREGAQGQFGGGEDLALYDRFTITDAEGKNQDLYVRNGVLSSSQEDIPMPPPPPDAEFDARFESGDFLRTVYPDSGVVELNIEVDANAYPLTLSWELRPENGITYSIGGGGLNKAAPSLVGSGSQQFASVHGRIIQLSGGSGERLGINTVPASFALHQNYPNPFNPETRIQFDLPQDARVELVVFDLLGRQVATLVNGPKVAGRHSAAFDASGLASGVYFYRIQATALEGTHSFHGIKKLVLVR